MKIKKDTMKPIEIFKIKPEKLSNYTNITFNF